MAQFLILVRRRTESFSEAEFAQGVDAELQRVRELYATDFIRQVWHRWDVQGGCLLVEASSEPEARQTVETLPLVEAGMVEVELVIPLTPFVGFGPR